MSFMLQLSQLKQEATCNIPSGIP